jgi:hypothetical protein
MMKKIILLSLLVTSAHGATFDFQLSAFSLKETALLSRGTSSNVETHLSYQIDENLKLNFWPGANFSSGQQASRDQVNVLANTIYVKEASAELKYTSFLDIKAGALNQKEFLPGLSGQAKAFPALGVRASFLPLSTFDVEVLAQAAVPTSTGLATNSSELQSSSTLLSATINFAIKSSAGASAVLSYSHFSFNDLTSSSAFDSAYRGNSVNRLSSSAYGFVYGYQGDEVLFRTSYSGELFDIKGKAGLVKNSLAPSQLNQGFFVSVEPGLKINEKNLLRVIASSFRVESDAMVAVFSDATFGRTNRSGGRLGIALEKKQYSWQLLYTRSDLIASNAFQSSDESLALDLAIRSVAF